MKSKQDSFQRADGTVVFNSGQVVQRFHLSDQCLGEVCPVHNPTDHKLRGEQLFFYGKHMLRRVGVDWFIDPDDYIYNLSGYALVRNSATCGSCGDLIDSIHRHDYVSCGCGAIAVDGGLEYLRRSYRTPDLLIETSIEFRKDEINE